VSSPEKTLARPTAKVKRIIKRMTNDKNNEVYIISGRPKNTLESYFENKGLGLVAEHGGWILQAGSWVKSTVVTKKWQKQAAKILKEYVAKTPGSVLEQKDFALVWHYRNSSPDLAFVRKEELKMELHNTISDSRIGIFEGEKIIEVKPKSMHKGAIVRELTNKQDYDFVLCIGDDYTDEEMFKALPESAHTIHVGVNETEAKHIVKNVNQVIDVLNKLK
jgi:trehalose 6-phosphate synthase/phosphatase